MFNLIAKIKFRIGRFSCVTSLSSASNWSALKLNHLSSSAANAAKPLSETPNQDSFSATYLKNIYGFTPERALLYSKYLKFDSPERPDSIYRFFKNHHFTDAQFSRMVRKWPYVLGLLPDKVFLPKIEFFQSMGLSSSGIVKVLTSTPSLLGRSLEGQIIPCVDLLRSLLMSDKDIVFSILRFPGMMTRNLQHVVLNVESLRGAGVPDSHIAAMLKIHPRHIIVIHPKRFRVSVLEVQKLGFDPQKKAFIKGVIAMVQLSSSTWKEKIDFYMKWGLSEPQVLDAFRRHPGFMAASTDAVSRTLDLLCNNMGWDISTVIKTPVVLSLSFERTIAPRCSFYQVLLSKGLMKQGSGLAMLLKYPKRFFFGRYVQRFEAKDPELVELYNEIFSGAPQYT